MKYDLSVTLDLPYEKAVAEVRAALKEQGFGVLTEIDVQATMREKLDALRLASGTGTPVVS